MEDVKTSHTIKLISNVKKEFRQLINHLESDIEKLNDPSAEALFEVAAKEITWLEKAFSDYEEKIKV